MKKIVLALLLICGSAWGEEDLIVTVNNDSSSAVTITGISFFSGSACSLSAKQATIEPGNSATLLFSCSTQVDPSQENSFQFTLDNNVQTKPIANTNDYVVASNQKEKSEVKLKDIL